MVPLASRFQNLSKLVNNSEKHRDDVRMEMACVLSGFIGKLFIFYAF